MALPTGLVPVLVFVLTVGIAVPVTLGSHLIYRNGNGAFGSALRIALLEASVLYLVGILVIWAIAGGLELWEIPITLLVTGVLTLIILVMLPLIVGRRFIQHFRPVDRETALRFATYGWPITMLMVFGTFIAPGGLVHGDLLLLGGKRICVAGFCGIGVSFVMAMVLEIVVAVLGPGIVGLVLYSSAVRTYERGAST
ncbi:hypothetical protein [Halomicrococcus gelatinilyticus]|uniref:hypothetical protein n=1 Tax=Halomicrococcus gelatinilyticus TaxID=1702103 RepID=UPI002E13C544